jgi:5-methylcytosine-specific restriction endonuclease McrA
MSLSPVVIDALVASGVTVEQLAAVVKAAIAADQKEREDAESRQRKAAADKMRRWRANQKEGWFANRRAVFERDEYRCRYCGIDVGEDGHCDHVIPKSRGGTDDVDNLVTACEQCNCSKGARTPEEWREAK